MRPLCTPQARTVQTKALASGRAHGSLQTCSLPSPCSSPALGPCCTAVSLNTPACGRRRRILPTAAPHWRTHKPPLQPTHQPRARGIVTSASPPRLLRGANRWFRAPRAWRSSLTQGSRCPGDGSTSCPGGRGSGSPDAAPPGGRWQSRGGCQDAQSGRGSRAKPGGARTPYPAPLQSRRCPPSLAARPYLGLQEHRGHDSRAGSGPALARAAHFPATERGGRARGGACARQPALSLGVPGG